MSLSNFSNPRPALDADTIKKTLLGIVPDLSTLFSEYAYVGESCEYGTLNGVRRVSRRFHTFPENFYYLRGPSVGTPIDSSFSTFVKQGFALCAKPVGPVRDYMIRRSLEGHMGSFEIIPWPNVGHALILGCDSTMIANVWLAFVPLDALPTINMQNTHVIAGVK